MSLFCVYVSSGNLFDKNLQKYYCYLRINYNKKKTLKQQFLLLVQIERSTYRTTKCSIILVMIAWYFDL